MRKFLFILICISLCCVPLAACNNEDASETSASSAAYDEEIFGTWAEEYFDSEYVFSDDGTGEDTFWELTFTYTAKDGKLKITFDDKMWGETIYDYSIKGDVLSLTQEGSEDTFDYHKR